MNLLLFDWLLLSSVVSAFWFGGLTFRKAINMHLRATSFYLVSSLLAVAIAALLMHISSRLSDAGLALLLTDVVMVVYILTTTKRLIDIPLHEVFKQVLDLRIITQPLLQWARHER